MRNFFIYFLILISSTSYCMESLGPNDLYAWQVFGTQDPLEIYTLYFVLPLFIRLKHIPEEQQILNVIEEACGYISNGLKYKVIKNAKPIFEKYLKPFIDKTNATHENFQGHYTPNQQIIPGPNDLYAWQIFETQDLNKVKLVYNKLALKFHPDRNRQPYARNVFEIIQEAYEARKEPTTFKDKIVKKSKTIFNGYIKPYLDDLKNPTKNANTEPIHRRQSIQTSSQTLSSLNLTLKSLESRKQSLIR